MGNSLEQLLAEGVISEILSRVKSGKEADVYTVRQGGKVVAAKVYKDHGQRSFKNNAVYQEGRQVRNSRSQRAMDRGSRFGKEAAEEAWKSAEANTIYKLHAAGVRVPTPVMFLEGVLFMELVLGENGYAAPRLIDTQLSADQANRAYHDMLTQLVRMLCCDLIHGDLSPYNVLWAATGPTIIDFPQSVSASHNNSSERFFLRDARNILGYFAGIDPRLRSRSGDAAEIWRAYVRRELSPDFVPSGRPMRPDTRPIHQPSAPRAASHRGPPPQGQRPNGQRNGGPNAKSFAPRERPAAAPNPARGPRRPEVLVLRRSPKASTPESGSSSQVSEPRSLLTAESRFTSARPRVNSHPNESNPNAEAQRRRRRRRG
ncbi:MAG TPA: RIO1 family regulatory kinase/ATPase [Polyangiaceae bacterium]|nr:RIO1 family regulatory kinase/ATPase [Polyangiaceae bacterium]